MSTDFGEKYASARDRLLVVMRDCAWHSWRELTAKAGVRYSARLRELRRLGYKFESEPVDEDGKQYRLLSPDPSSPAHKRVKVYLEEGDVEAMLSMGAVSLRARAELAEALSIFKFNKHKL